MPGQRKDFRELLDSAARNDAGAPPAEPTSDMEASTSHPPRPPIDVEGATSTVRRRQSDVRSRASQGRRLTSDVSQSDVSLADVLGSRRERMPVAESARVRTTYYVDRRLAERVDREARRLSYEIGGVSKAELHDALLVAGFERFAEIEAALRARAQSCATPLSSAHEEHQNGNPR